MHKVTILSLSSTPSKVVLIVPLFQVAVLADVEPLVTIVTVAFDVCVPNVDSVYVVVVLILNPFAFVSYDFSVFLNNVQ